MIMIPPNQITLLSTNVLEDDAPVYLPTADYPVDTSVVYSHKVYKAIAVNGPTTSNVTTPGTNPLVWKDSGATNAYKMIDAYITTQTVNADVIEIVFDTPRLDTVALFNFECVSIDIEVRDQITEAVVSTKTISYTELIGIPSASWSDYWFSNITPKTDIAINIGEYYGAHVMIRLNSTGGFAKLGTVIIGKEKILGNVLFAPSLGFIDYSKVLTNTDGELFLQKGNFAKRNNYAVIIDTAYLDTVYKQIIDRRGQLTVFIGHRSYEAFLVYGFVKNFDLVYPNHLTSEFNLEIEGIAK